jgi:hypothetical protein
MREIPAVEGLSWSKIRVVAGTFASSAPVDEVARLAAAWLGDPDPRRRQMAVYLLGFTSSTCPTNLTLLRERVVPDSNWEVQEALAQAFDAYCAATGYEAALPMIDAWLADGHPHARRAVTEGLRPWTSKARAYFAAHPQEAIRRLAALRADPSSYVRHSVGNALRDIRRNFPDLVDAETSGWNLANADEAFTYQRVLKAH